MTKKMLAGLCGMVFSLAIGGCDEASIVAEEEALVNAEAQAVAEDEASERQISVDEGLKDLIIFEGRDAAGKDGVIKRITEHLSVRHTRAVALPTVAASASTRFVRASGLKGLPFTIPMAASWPVSSGSSASAGSACTKLSMSS